jgi:hypothetical protein
LAGAFFILVAKYISGLNCLFLGVEDQPVISLDSEGEIEEGEEDSSVGLVIR